MMIILCHATGIINYVIVLHFVVLYVHFIALAILLHGHANKEFGAQIRTSSLLHCCVAPARVPAEFSMNSLLLLALLNLK